MADSKKSVSYKKNTWVVLFLASIAALNLYFFTYDILVGIDSPTQTSLSLAGALLVSILALKS